MYDTDPVSRRIQELMGEMELSATEHRKAQNAQAARAELARWYAALRELATMRAPASQARGAAAVSN